MNKLIPAAFCWSGGKDSSYALWKIMQEGMYEVKYLISTFSTATHRLSMHGIRVELIEAQAASLNIPLIKVWVDGNSNENYEQAFLEKLNALRLEQIEHVIFGDIFLEDLRIYREALLKKIQLKCVFPIWQIDTRYLVKDFIKQHFKSVICCVSDAFFKEGDVGKLLNDSFISQLPSDVDACGENGEFHTYCFDGPIFDRPIDIVLGEKKYFPLPLVHPQPESDKNFPKGFWYQEVQLKK